MISILPTGFVTLGKNLLHINKNMVGGIVQDFFNLLYPPLCAACRSVLVKQEKHICTSCLYNLPKTNFHLDMDNSMARLFWGRIRIEAAAACYYFERGSKCRKIIHQIKYRGRKELALLIGTIYGKELSLCERFTSADMIIPVPLHPDRLRKRGFNQSEWFACGLACSFDKQVFKDILIRSENIETQTNKSRIERWENVENSFSVCYPERIENKHILLVDDVVTTGATLECCASLLMDTNGVSLSILTIAYA